ncbi:cell cycle progression protein 1 isoform X2 [Etheostoma spectabile]|uniref:cell cycle progression protein 1 isoform X2 n=1 Tax=Etheostoma spectabile TaxID=54343 RepID=UPI0013AEB598|nr:cell cycle progression protein 1 isoform X2 [Etheostoma spectabile]
MSETSSDAESSCGWTIISNEGSDIETLGLEAAVEYGAEPLVRPSLEEAELREKQASTSNAQCVEKKVAEFLDETLEQQTIDETLCDSEAEDTAGKQHVTILSSSDHSDIVTLGDLKEDEQADAIEEVATNKEFYLGTSCSSQYAFTATEAAGLMLSHWKLPQSLVNLGYHLRSQLTGGRSFPVFPVQQPTLTNSSSSEDEGSRSASTVVRRRRLRKNTTSIVTEPEEGEELLEYGRSEEEGEEEEVKKQTLQQEEEAEIRSLDERMQGRARRILNSCIFIALVVAISMGFGHFYGPRQQLQPQYRCYHDDLWKFDVVRDLIQQHVREQSFTNQVQRGDDDLDDLDEQTVILLLTEVIEKIKTENQEVNTKQAQIQAQRDNLEMLLKQKAEERNNIVSQQQSLTAENQQLKTSLEREEKSLSTLQEELRNLRSKIRDLEAMGAGADSLLFENQRLKDQLEEEKQLIQSFHVQRGDMMAEAQTLRKKLEKERAIIGELRRELNVLRSHIPRAGKEAGSEPEELQSRLMELEERLSFEQQRSDLWERLYVETKEDRVKGDKESKVKRTKEGMAGKVRETFDAVKNSTKEFVHHHKEQIKKAKEAVKENLRKFSDSVKLTFRHFKNSASTVLNKARGFYDERRDEKNTEESWQHRSHKPPHRHQHKYDSSQNNHNTRKSGDKVHQDRAQNAHKANLNGCYGVFDCAYQESMSLFNKAMDPIRADEFYQLLQSYLQQEVDHFHHWKELEMFVNNFFHNGVFIHEQMLFTDFVSGVENYLTGMHEYHGLDDDVFRDLDDFVYRHFFGEAYRKSYGPNGPFERPDTDWKEPKAKHQQRKQQRARSRPHGERKWSRSGRNADRHMADVKIELGPMPFDPKY